MRTYLQVLVSAALLPLLALGCSERRDQPDLALAAGPLAPSFNGAGPPQTGGGEGFLTRLEVIPIREAGGNRIEERIIEGVLTGALEGTFVEHARGVVHRNGLVTFQATFEFEGTVAGCGTGTLTAALSGRGQAGAEPVTEANFRVINQASNTLKVAGTGTMHQVGPFITYEVKYVCK